MRKRAAQAIVRVLKREAVSTYYIGGASGTDGRLGLYTAGVRGASSQGIMRTARFLNIRGSFTLE